MAQKMLVLCASEEPLGVCVEHLFQRGHNLGPALHWRVGSANVDRIVKLMLMLQLGDATAG